MTIRFILASISAAALALATAAPALAHDHPRHHGHGRHNGWLNNDDHDHGYGNRGYYNNGYGNRHDEGYRRHRGDNGTALGIGLGVVGLALVLSAVNSGNKNKTRYERRDDRYDRDGWYRGEPRHNNENDWHNPDGVIAYQGRGYSQFSSNECLQTREYQTRITVGGRSREAYGTACLTSGGQWLQGPPMIDPDDR